MHIKIDNPTKTVRSMQTRNGQRFIAEQPALMFKEGENYPDKITITLGIEEQEHIANNKQPLDAGDYDFTDDCFNVSRYGAPEFRLQPQNMRPKSKANLAKAG